MATVRKRKWIHNCKEAEAWVVNYTDQNGKRRQKTFVKKKDADRYRTKIDGEIDQGVHVADRNTVTVSDLVDRYIADCERRHRIGDQMTGQSLATKRSFFRNYITPKIGNVKLSYLTSNQIEEMIESHSNQYSYHTLRHIHSLLSGALVFAVRKKWVRRNILKDEPISLPQVRRNKVCPPSKEQIKTRWVQLVRATARAVVMAQRAPAKPHR